MDHGDRRADQPARAALEAKPTRDVLGRRAEHSLSPTSQTRVGVDAGRAPLVTREMPLEDGESGHR